jgi:Response regulator containing a CheY-like receiver domain and an HTH DNA-binding domain
VGIIQRYEGAIEPAAPPNRGLNREQAFDQFLQCMRAEDYGAMLGFGLRHMTMARIGGVPYELTAVQIAKNCTEEVRRENPEKLLRLAYELYCGGLADEYGALMREIAEMIPSLPLSGQKKRHLKGEWLIVSALPFTRDIKKVVGIYEQAAPLMCGPSLVIDAADSITLGIHGMPGVYLLRPGMADKVRSLIPRLTELFSRFTGETLCGLEELYDASLAYYRGSIDEARQLTYKAIYLLERTRQDVLQISAGEQLALIAIHQGDADCFDEAVDYLKTAVQRSVNREACRGLAELIHCGLLNALGEYKDTPRWLKSFAYASGAYGTGPFGDRNIAGNAHFAPVSYGAACWHHALYLYASGQPQRALAKAEIMLRRLNAEDGVVILAVYFSLVAACSHMALNDRRKAQEYIDRAVALALPDRLFVALGAFASRFDGMMEKTIAKYDKHAAALIRRINRRYMSGMDALTARYAADELPETLTRRERDVARLAAGGLRNSEIAQRLSVSESTVRAHLRSVFQKLDIDRRARLAEKLK